MPTKVKALKTKSVAGKKTKKPATPKPAAIKKVPAKKPAKSANVAPPKGAKAPAKKSAPVKAGVILRKKTTGAAPAKKLSAAKKPATGGKPFPSQKSVTPPAKQKELLACCVRALDEKKADDIRVIFVGEKSSITDYFVIATGNSEPQLRAMRNELEKELDKAGVKLCGTESGAESGWWIVDAFDVMVHMFLPGQRANYKLEALWKDGTEIPAKTFLA